tara:strand:- start:61213 stop:62412 length:1200 start_codon:yes stop_codon:yes gene_type:complete
VHANSANEKVSENKIQYTLAEKQYKERQFEMAKETLLSLMDDTEYEARSRILLARVLVYMNQFELAIEQIVIAQKLKLNNELKRTSILILNYIKENSDLDIAALITKYKPKYETAWKINPIIGIERVTDIAVPAIENTLFVPQREDDTVYTGGVGLEYTVKLNRLNHIVSAKYQFSQQKFEKFDNFNTGNHNFSLKYTANLNKRSKIDFKYKYNTVVFDGFDVFSENNSIGTSYLTQQMSFDAFKWYGRYAFDLALKEYEESREADNITPLVSVSQIVQLPRKNTYVSLSYSGGKSYARNENFDYITHRVLTNMGYGLGKLGKFSLGFSFANVNFDENDLIQIDESRDDNIYSYNFEYRYPVFKKLELLTYAKYKDYRSNLDRLDYSSSKIGMMIEVDF